MTKFVFSFEKMPDWPPLAWLCKCEKESAVVTVHYGSGVEIQSDWFCEAVWDSDFQSGNFDQTDAVFGTGGRIRSDGIHFVSSGSTVDRLQVITIKENFYISNSLPCVLEAARANLDPAFSGYMGFFTSIRFGIKRHQAILPLKDGSVQLVYFNNLIWDGTKLRECEKPFPRHSLQDFTEYCKVVQKTLERIGNNLADLRRLSPYTWLGTLSKGYDSPTGVALAKQAGLKRAFTFNESRPGIKDNGDEIAQVLDVDCMLFDRLGWHGDEVTEPLFLVADGQGKEISMASVGNTLDRTVVVTGHGGDFLWSLEPGHINENLMRGDYSGLSMTEFRLHRRFIHLPLPFLAMRQVSDIVQISRSTEMNPWHTGGNYSRPICRRILEERGVGRTQFGVHKTGNSVRFLTSQDAWSKTGERSFLIWLCANRQQAGLTWLRWIKTHSIQAAIRYAIFGREKLPWPFNRICQRAYLKLLEAGSQNKLEDMAFVWAMECTRKKYQSR